MDKPRRLADAFLRPHIKDSDTLARMYKILKEAYDPGISTDKELARKTAKLPAIPHSASCSAKAINSQIIKRNNKPFPQRQNRAQRHPNKKF